MSTRTAYAGTAEDGDIYTAANHAKMAGGWVGYSSIETAAGTTAADELTLHTEDVPVGANRRIKITWVCPESAMTAASDIYLLKLVAGADERTFAIRSEAGGAGVPTNADGTWVGVFDIATPGNVTCKVTMARAAGSGTWFTNFGAAGPRVMVVEDIGPTS